MKQGASGRHVQADMCVLGYLHVDRCAFRAPELRLLLYCAFGFERASGTLLIVN